MLLPHQAGEDPFAKNRPTTATLGIDLPDVFDAEANPGGMAVNVARIVQCAQYAGWHAEQYDELRTTLVLRKHGRGYLRVYFSVMGRVISASTQRRNLAPRTARVLEYLEGK